MKTIQSIHSFHIPVMGLAYTIDSPIRVAQFGITSVISIIDDELMEKMNAFYSHKFKLNYHEITPKIHDHRVKRITAYLNLVDLIVKRKFEYFKEELLTNKEAISKYIEMLPNKSELKKGLENFIQDGKLIKENIKNYLEKNLFPGAIDVNIMTKVDKENYINNELLPTIFNDAHASLRGFANSTLSSSVVLSAGMNPRLYSYFESFSDFFPDENGNIKKKIILKVSDYRSAMIQGNFLAKKGLWVSEYRIESGLNCGGHAFATEGFLLGPILQEFKEKKNELRQNAHELLVKALINEKMNFPINAMELKITAQGGVGTSDEHDFLLSHYNLDSVGWGSPFLLVSEATSVDFETRQLLAKSVESDFYLSTISPLGIPFNTIKGMSNEILKNGRINENKAGSSCPKKLLALNKEYSDKGICTASKKYQNKKIEDLLAKKTFLSKEEFNKNLAEITKKSCLCVGLANASYLENNIKMKGEAQGVVICPGPNLAYFDKEVSLSKMVQHIYGNTSVLRTENRPNMFINELKMYVDYLKNEILETKEMMNPNQIKKLLSFKKNLLAGIEYYVKMFSETPYFKNNFVTIQNQLYYHKEEIISIEIPGLEIA